MNNSNEDSLVKIDALISGIRMINLHVYNYLGEYLSPRLKGTKEEVRQQQLSQLKRLNIAHFQQNMKFISQYLKRSLQDMSKIRIYLTPLVYRPLRNRAIKNQNFLRFENANYGIKFIFTELIKECLMNIEIYRKAEGLRVSGEALRKLQLTFMHDISIRYPDSQFTADILQYQGKSILDQVTTIFNGQRCPICQKHLFLNIELMIFLPPTVREILDPIQAKNLNKTKRYYHQSCI